MQSKPLTMDTRYLEAPMKVPNPIFFSHVYMQALSVASTMLQFHHHSYSSLPLAFTFYGAPNIDSLNPSVGTFGGAHMTWLSGQNFVTDGVYELHCLFGNLSQSIRFISSAIVTCDVPLLLEYGSVDVAISTTLRRPLNVRPEVICVN
mmetsp:Transcript_6574/g.17756  ORF Transcript_6574/g.17756 Transcript_6574/m.17756 type:complete len:148 (+) Transcript_6574:1172-1615(+)